MPQAALRRKLIAATHSQRHWYFPTQAGNLQSLSTDCRNCQNRRNCQNCCERTKLANRPILAITNLQLSLSLPFYENHCLGLRVRNFSRQLFVVSGGTDGRQAAPASARRFGRRVDNLPGLLPDDAAAGIPVRTRTGDAFAASRASYYLSGVIGSRTGGDWLEHAPGTPCFHRLSGIERFLGAHHADWIAVLSALHRWATFASLVCPRISCAWRRGRRTESRSAVPALCSFESRFADCAGVVSVRDRASRQPARADCILGHGLRTASCLMRRCSAAGPQL